MACEEMQGTRRNARYTKKCKVQTLRQRYIHTYWLVLCIYSWRNVCPHVLTCVFIPEEMYVHTYWLVYLFLKKCMSTRIDLCIYSWRNVCPHVLTCVFIPEEMYGHTYWLVYLFLKKCMSTRIDLCIYSWRNVWPHVLTCVFIPEEMYVEIKPHHGHGRVAHVHYRKNCFLNVSGWHEDFCFYFIPKVRKKIQVNFLYY